MNENLPSPSSDEISLKELIQKIGEWYRYLKTQWWKIAIAGFIGGVIGFIYTWMQPITYTAKTTFVVEDAKSPTGQSLFIRLLAAAGETRTPRTPQLRCICGI